MVCRPGVWYCEDFEDQKAQSWQLAPNWRIQYSSLLSRGRDFAFLGEHNWEDYRLQFDFLLESGTIHLNYRILPTSNGLRRYFIGINSEGYYLQRQDSQTPYSLVYDLWQNYDYWFQTGVWHHVDIAGWGGHLIFVMDGVTFLNYVDEGYIPNGSIAFETLDNSIAQVDNIEVEGSGEEPSLPSTSSSTEEENSGVTILEPEVLPIACTTTYMTWENDTDRPGLDYWTGTESDPIESIDMTAAKCSEMCYTDSQCMAFTFYIAGHQCWLKNGIPDAVYATGLISGVRACK